MAKDIYSFRISPEAKQRLEQLKADGVINNPPDFINSIIMSYNGKADGCNASPVIRVVPEEGMECYKAKDGYDTMDIVKFNSIPFCSMNIKRHAEARKIIASGGMDYFYFPVDKEMCISMAIIAASIEEASILFQKYYTYDRESGRYVRTAYPLPQYRYDPTRKNVIIVEYDV